MKKSKLVFLTATLLALSLPAQTVYATQGMTPAAETAVESQTETETITESQTETKTITESQTEAETTIESQAETETTAKAEPETKPEPEEDADSGYKNKKIVDFISRLYDKFLGRTADETGLETWYTALESGDMDGATVVSNFVLSDEFLLKDLSTKEFLDIMYAGIFNRGADESGLKTWTDLMNNGLSKRYICAKMVESDEFHNLCNSYNITPGSVELTENRDLNANLTQFVYHFYKECLDREADIDGLNSWTGGLLNGNLTGADITNGFIFSKEFTDKNLSDEDYIKTLYKTLLSRTYDEPGLQDWLTHLDNGVSRYYIAVQFLHSTEFANLCSTYGIQKGEASVTENRDKNYNRTIFVSNLYKNAFKRAASADELNSYTDKLYNKSITGEEIANAFFLSAEYTNRKTDDTTFITDLYNGLLQRVPSEAEINALKEKIKSNGRQGALDSIRYSDEYRDICTKAEICPLRSGWIKTNGQWYYNENTKPKTGWLRIDGYRYYLDPAKGGARTTGWAYIDGYKFYFYDNGIMATDLDSVIGIQSSYMIKVYKWGNYAIVFAKDGDNGYIIPVRAMLTSCGNATPVGTFYTPAKFRWLEMMGGCYAQWCTQIYGDFLFHSVPYVTTNNQTLYTSLMYNYLGQIASHGCIRLKAGDAKWVYDHCRIGTTVVIDANHNSGPFDKPAFTPLPSWHTWDPTDPTAYYLCQQHGCH